MNRSFRATAPAMDKGDDLALFLEVRNREKDRNNLLFLSDDDGHKPSSISPLLKTVSSGVMPVRRTAVEEFLNSDGDKNDYDWLITPPGTPLFPCLEMEACNRSPPTGHAGTPKARQNVLKSRLAYSADSSSRNILTSRQVTTSSGLSSSSMGTRRLSSSGSLRAASRPPTPTGRSTLSATSKPSRPVTPTGRATSSATSKPSRPTTPTGRATSSATSKPSRPSTPTKQVVPHPRTSAPSLRSSTLPSVRSSVPTSTRSSVPSTRPSTPTSRPSLSAPNKPAPRPATPTRRTSAPSSLPTSNAPSARSSPVLKSGHTTSKSSAPSRGTSPVRSRAWKPSDMPGFSLEAPPNLRTSLPERPSSACRGRPGAPISRSSSIVPEPIVRPRRQSCSPSRGRPPNGNGHSGSSVPAARRPHLNGGDNVSPVLIGSKMVERVVNARKLAPPKQDERRSSNSGKSSTSPDSVGFGRTMSKKSLDMALRHMDIRRSIPNNLRPLMTNIPPSIYSARSGSTRSRSVSVSGSPMATSSNASSDQSFNNIVCLYGSEMEDDLCSYKGGNYSPAGPLAR